MTRETQQKQRQRAPSQKSLATRKRILDSAEQLFAERGYAGASIRDIASAAGVQGALVNHHCGGKEQLFFTTVARRADELSQLRLSALAAAGPDPDLRAILTCFIAPFLDKVLNEGAEWSAYGRLIAHVSADERWRHIAAACFDPTANAFVAALSRRLPHAAQDRVGAHFVFMVSSMLSICTSRWRIAALAGGQTDADMTTVLLDYCEAGFAILAAPDR